MATVNSKGEVADLLSVDQFIPSKSEYECVAYAAALLKYAGRPGQGPTGSVMAASNLAQYWYGRETGSDAASNTSGMSLPQEYAMLSGMGLSYRPLAVSIQAVKDALGKGYPVLLCGAETGMHDLALGDAVPYAWTPTGNHAIVVSGVTSDGNLLVHDTASIAPSGVRPGPRTYDASKMQLVSATAVVMPWLRQEEETVMIDLTMPDMAARFTLEGPAGDPQWRSKKTGKVIHGAILEYYRTIGAKPYCGYSLYGHPKSEEIPLDSEGSTKQYFERGVLAYDPHGKYGPPLGAGSVYALELYTDGPGTDPAIAQLQSQIAALKAQDSDPTFVASLQAKIAAAQAALA